MEHGGVATRQVRLGLLACLTLLGVACAPTQPQSASTTTTSHGAVTSPATTRMPVPSALRRSQVSAAGSRSTAYTVASGRARCTASAIAPDPLHRSTTVVASIGPVTAEAAQQLGIETTVMPARYTIPDLVDALVEYFGQEREHEVRDEESGIRTR